MVHLGCLSAEEEEEPWFGHHAVCPPHVPLEMPRETKTATCLQKKRRCCWSQTRSAVGNQPLHAVGVVGNQRTHSSQQPAHSVERHQAWGPNLHCQIAVDLSASPLTRYAHSFAQASA